MLLLINILERYKKSTSRCLKEAYMGLIENLEDEGVYMNNRIKLRKYLREFSHYATTALQDQKLREIELKN